MQSRDFVFWLQGFFELTLSGPITAEQAALIKAHLDLVFQHDPSIPKAQVTHPIPNATPVAAPNVLDLQRAFGGSPDIRAQSIC